METNNNKNLKWLIFLALFLFGLFCFMKDRGYCNEFDFYQSGHVSVENEYLFQHYDCRSNWQAKPGRSAPASHDQRKRWQEAFDMHNFNAIRTYQDAYNRVWWLPNLTWRQLGRDAWVSACSMASTKSPTAALVVAFSTMLSQYGLHCMDEWDYIADKLYWSEYHFNECARYAALLNG